MRVLWLTQLKGNPPLWMQRWMYAATYAVLAMTLVALVVPLLTGEKVKLDPQTGKPDKEHQPFKNTIAAVCFTVLKYLIMIGLYVGTISIIYGTYTYKPPAGSWPGDKIPPVSPAMDCTMKLTTMYFIVYAGIQAGKTFESFSGVDSSKLTGALQGAICTMFFAPMMAVLFIGVRMRAMQMDPINVPVQKWAQNWFYACTYGVMIQCILAVTVPLILGGTVKEGDKGIKGDVEYEVNNSGLGAVFVAARWIIMFSIYIGISCVIYALFEMEHPKGPEYTPPISVTMQCVVNLTVQFFVVYTLIWIAATVKELTGWEWHFITNAMENAKGTLAFCPMLSILFVATRMRAMTLTNWKGAPQGWAQDGMYMATWSVLIQFLMVLLIPLCTLVMEGKATHAECDEDGNVKYKPEGKIALVVVEIIRWLGFVLLYGGVITV